MAVVLKMKEVLAPERKQIQIEARKEREESNVVMFLLTVFLRKNSSTSVHSAFSMPGFVTIS